VTQAYSQPLFQPLSFFSALSSWVAAYAAQDDDLDFYVLPLDLSFNALPTYSVRVLRENRAIALYKCNLAVLTDEDGRACALFSPLVVTWSEDRPPEGDISRRIIAHCLDSAHGFCASKQVMPEMDVIVTSGNLTKERAGLPFFTALGWDIVMAGATQTPIYQKIITSLEKAAAAFLEENDGPVSFAVVKLPAADA